MKTLVNGMAAAVRKAPWAVIIITVVITFALGFGAQNFQPSDDQNESFAPDAPELVAADRINELYGAESTASIMQVIVTSTTGDVLTLNGLDAAHALTETAIGGALSPWLFDQRGTGPVVHYVSPVDLAVAQGAPAPTSDAMVKQLYGQAIAQAPPEQVGLALGLLPESADQAAMTSPSGLLLIFTTGPETTEDFDAFADASAAAAAELQATDLPNGITAEPFSFELLFSDTDDFQAEIGRLFATAGFIIFLVLSIIFMVRPRTRRDRTLGIVGIVFMFVAIGVLVLPSLGTLFPDAFPDWVSDMDVGPVLLIAAGIYFAVYLVWSLGSKGLRRTTADTLVTVLAIGLAITWMNGYGGFRFGSQGPMAQIIPILLIGLGVDYSIHMTSRYREEVFAGHSVDGSVSRAIKTVGVALVLATVTTVVGFLTNVFNEIPALREFGELAAVGIIASFVLMLTFVPAVRELLDRRGERKGTLEPTALEGGATKRLPRLIGRASVLPKSAAIATVIVSLVLGAAGAFGTTKVSAEFSFIDFIPTTSPLRGTFETLVSDYGGGFGETTQVLIEGDVATAETWNAMVASTRNLSEVDNVLQVGGFPAAESPVSVLGQLANPDSPAFNVQVGLAAQAAGMSQDSLAVSADADIGALYDAMFATDPEATGRVLTPGYQSALFTIQTQAGESGAGQLATDLDAAFEPVTAAGLESTVTSDEIISDVIVTTLRNSQLSSLLLTLGIALLVLLINFWVEVRRPMLGVITTIPVVLVVLWSFALMALFGIPFGPVTATVSALAIGIGIPYMIHVTHRYEEDRARNGSENDAIEQTLVHTGGALGGSALTTIAGFGILMTSTTIPFRQFGFVTAYTILLALLAAVLVLPSYLVLWDRWHRRRGDETFDRMALEAALQEDLTAEA